MGYSGRAFFQLPFSSKRYHSSEGCQDDQDYQLPWNSGTWFHAHCAFLFFSSCLLQVLELAVRGGKRETIHKGPLRVIRVGKEAGVRLEYFYIFNDVVSNGNRTRYPEDTVPGGYGNRRIW